MDINFTLIGQMITFMIFVYFTMTFVWPPFNEMLTDRKNKIIEGLLAAEKSKKELEIAKTKAKEIINKAREKSKSIIARSYLEATDLSENIKKSAEKNSNHIKKTAYEEIESYKNRIKEELYKEAIDISILAAEKIINKNIDKKSNQYFLDKLILSI